MYIHITYTHTNKCKYIIHTHTHTHAYIYICTHAHAHTPIHIQVRVLVVTDMPHGWGKLKKPKFQKELWVHDPDRPGKKIEGEPFTVLHVQFDSDFDVSPASTHPRGDDSVILAADLTFSTGTRH